MLPTNKVLSVAEHLLAFFSPIFYTALSTWELTQWEIAMTQLIQYWPTTRCFTEKWKATLPGLTNTALPKYGAFRQKAEWVLGNSQTEKSNQRKLKYLVIQGSLQIGYVVKWPHFPPWISAIDNSKSWPAMCSSTCLSLLSLEKREIGEISYFVSFAKSKR